MESTARYLLLSYDSVYKTFDHLYFFLFLEVVIELLCMLKSPSCMHGEKQEMGR